MKYVDLYVAEVGRHLPEKTRADIEKEIRSMIEDSLDDESQAQGRPVDEAMELVVLKRLGPPEKLAASYLPPRYLIGPELFPHFLNLMRAAAALVTLVAAVVFGVSLGQGPANLPQDIAQAFAQGIASFLDALFHAFGIVVIIFAIIQFASPGLNLEKTEWDPRKLKDEPDTERVSLPEKIFGIFLTVIAIIVFNLYPAWLGLSSIVNGQWVHVPVLNEYFFRLVPWISLVWALDAGHSIWLLSKGRWTPALRWFEIGLHLANIVLMGVLLFGPAFFTIDPASAARLGWSLDAQQVQSINHGLYLGIRIALGLGLVFTIWETIQQVYKLALRGRLPIFELKA